MTMTLEKLSSGSSMGLANLSVDRHRRSADSCTPSMMLDNYYIEIPTPSTRSVSPLSASVSPGKDKSFSFFRSVYRKMSLKSHEDLDQLATANGRDEDSRSSSVDSYSSSSDHRDPSSNGKSGPEEDEEEDEENRRYSSGSRSSRRTKMQLRLADLTPLASTNEAEINGSNGANASQEPTTRRKSRRSSVLKLLESLAISSPIRSRSLSCSSSSVNNLLHAKGRDSRAESKCSLFSTNSANNANGDRSAVKESNKPAPKKILRRPVSYTYLRGISGLPTQRVPRSSICCSYYGR
ncbi:uncharacterized protein LOC118467090 [Anopheles albimanus]|uniref:DUF4797 domain-containing protein n=1 Tax=Anopheles albimanus TaxID=7167 RepID=A0A182FH16_ANOAL|nr:uncharacterized protein LOC118467090 [Anopheles albimanus]